MVERSDITVIQDTDPRYAEIASPSTEIVMQDYVDTLRTLEDDFQNMSFDKLIDATGKQNLGGGTLVAITVEEKNLQLAFQSRFTPDATGTVTTASGPPNQLNRITFVDSSADFISAGVVPGSYLINWTDRSVTDVVRVINATTLETKVLNNGTDNEWDIGDDYSLWNITQVRTSGGNLVAVDENDTELPAILPTWGTQVILTTSSSATIQELQDIQFASFNGGVTINTAGSNPNAVSGTAFPAGTLRTPCDNWDDAKAIADLRGFSTYYIQDNTTIPTTMTGPTLDDSVFIGESPGRTTITIPAGADVTDGEYRSATVTGTLDGNSMIVGCIIDTLAFVNGQIKECGLNAITITLGGGVLASLIDCWDEGTGVARPTIDMGGSGQDLNVVRWSGGIKISNMTGMDDVVIDLTSGEIELDASITDGNVFARGVGTLIDNSGATVTNDLLNETTVAAAVWNALVATYSAAGSFGQLLGRKVITVAKFLGLK